MDAHIPEEGWAAFIQRAQAVNPALKVIITFSAVLNSFTQQLIITKL